VRDADDLHELRSLMGDRVVPIVAKIETKPAIEHIDAILDATDALMVARGDLGVELPFEQVPLAQKRMIQLCNLTSRPVITATQMLESMIENPRPTRAEASDVANAIIDGTDAVMLSAETAAGKFPVEAVKAMVRIAAEIEQSHIIDTGPHYDMVVEPEEAGATPTEWAIAAATVEAVRRIDAPLIVTFTQTGFTARVVSSFRPPVPVLALTDDARTYRQLALVWGVVPVLMNASLTFDETLDFARRCASERGLAAPGDRIVVTAGLPIHTPGTTNFLRVEKV
jgi:pyruvate kinase